MNQPIEVQQKAARPHGLLPKHVQSWLLAGLAFLMIVIMWLTKGSKPPTTGKPASPATSAKLPMEVNQAKIAELQNRIEDLQRQQLVAQSALAQQTRLLATPGDAEQPPQAATLGTGRPRAEDQLATERKNRAYTSLFASNVALSFRTTAAAPSQNGKQTSPAPAPLPSGTDTAQVAELLREAQASLAPAAPAPPEKERKEEARNPAAATEGAANAAAGKTYLVFEGTILETVLINRLEGQFPGPIECLLATDLYSNDRQHLLVPAGSKLLGETKKVDTFGQTRLGIAFHRLLMPDGYSVSLDQFKGLDQIGSTGLRDEVNNHYLRIFGTSLAVGALGAVGEYGTGNAFTANGGDLMRQGFAQSTAQSSAQILDRFLNVLPTVTIREGYRVKVLLSGDLALPEYKNHQMPSSL